MEINEAKKCKECKGIGSFSTDYIDADHNVQRGAGDDVTCENCAGTGREPDEEIVQERIIENLSTEQEEVLQAKFMEEREIGGIPIIKDNYEDLFENWLGSLSLSTLEEYLN